MKVPTLAITATTEAWRPPDVETLGGIRYPECTRKLQLRALMVIKI